MIVLHKTGPCTNCEQQFCHHSELNCRMQSSASVWGYNTHLIFFIGYKYLLLLLFFFLFFFFFFFFFHWQYSPLWALAYRTMSLYVFLSATNSLHLLTPSTWRSLSTSSFHLFLGLPLLLIPSSSWVKIFLGLLKSSILSRWPNQLILCPFIHFTIFSPLRGYKHMFIKNISIIKFLEPLRTKLLVLLHDIP